MATDDEIASLTAEVASLKAKLAEAVETAAKYESGAWTAFRAERTKWLIGGVFVLLVACMGLALAYFKIMDPIIQNSIGSLTTVKADIEDLDRQRASLSKSVDDLKVDVTAQQARLAEVTRWIQSDDFKSVAVLMNWSKAHVPLVELANLEGRVEPLLQRIEITDDGRLLFKSDDNWQNNSHSFIFDYGNPAHRRHIQFDEGGQIDIYAGRFPEGNLGFRQLDDGSEAKN